MRTLLLGAVLWAGTPAPVSLGATDYLAQGRIFFEEFEYAQCLVALGHALRQPSTPAEAVSIQIYSGLCHYHLGQLENARSAFRIALRLDPRAQLPPLSSPKIARFFEETSRQLPQDAPELPPPPAPADDLPARAELTPKRGSPPTPLLQTPAPTERKSLLLPGILTGGAVAGSVVGVIWGVQAKRLEAEANAAEFDFDGVRLERRAQQSAVVANVAFGIAAAAGVAALVSYLVQ